MRDREAAMKAGLRKFTQRDCEVCHYVKGSHVAVHHKPKIDIEAAWKALAHPVPEGGTSSRPAAAAPPPAIPGPKYVGALACGTCHQGPMMGYQLSLWRMSRHAQAYATLATPRADDVARTMGVAGDPQVAAACLKCHATGGGPQAPASGGFSHFEGVGCESCHGAGSDYQAEPVMRDRVASRKAGLRPVTEKTCAACHANAHGKPFDFAKAKAQIAHPTRPESERAALGKRTALGAGSAQEWDVQAGAMTGGSAQSLLEHFEVTYKNPVNLAFRPDGREVWVACEASGSVAVVDAATRARVAEVTVGGQATDVAFSPDGTRAYVTSRLNDSVSVIDVASRKVVQAIPVADEPHGVAVDPAGRTLFVLGTAFDAVSVVDLASGKETKRLAASRNPWSAALSPDGKRLLVTNALSRFVKFRTPPMSEVTVLDVEGKKVEDRWVVPESNLLLGVAWHPSGEFALATMNRTKNLVPMTRILQGWTITNGLAVLWKGGRVDQVLLDEPQRYFADVTDVAFTPGREDGGRHERGVEPRRDPRRGEARGPGPSHPGRGPAGRPAELARGLGGVRGGPGGDEGQPPGRRGGAGRKDGLGGEHPRRLAVRDRSRARGGRGARGPRRAEEDDPHPPGREALPQREHHLPAPVRLRDLPPRRARGRPHLRHRGRRASG